MELLRTLLQVLVPLLERRVLSAERQAAACERQEALLREYLYWCHSEFRDQQLGIAPDPSAPPDVYADAGPARDLKQQQLDALRALCLERHGAEPTDESLWEMYEHLYGETAEQRADPDTDGDGVRH